jgi:poly(3-hydroxybutyrate) depolymerase
VAGLGSGTQKYYVYVPNDYTPARSWPLVLALHGVAPAPGTSYAIAVRDTWASVAASGHFIVAAPVADQAVDVNGQAGVTWMVPPTFGRNDYDLFAAVRADLEAAYNIERTRLYAWGFSAGGDVVHGLGLDRYSSVFDSTTLAAYSVSAGDLAGFACADLTDADCNALLAGSARKIPVDLHVGTGDSYYLQSTADDHNRFVAAGWVDGQTFFYTTFNGNHTYSQADLSDAWANLCRYAVVP